MKKIFAVLLALCLLPVAGCGKEPAGTDSRPAGDYSLCAKTSGCQMAETAEGYYLLNSEKLYYADKTDLSTWAPVCNAPDCNHSGYGCGAEVGSSFLLHDGRIYFIDDYVVYDSTKSGPVLASMAPNGSDRQLAYSIADTVDLTGSYSFTLTPEALVACWTKLNSDGLYEYNIARVDETGERMLYERTADSETSLVGLPVSRWGGTLGDMALYTDLVEPSDDPLNRVCIPTEDGVETLDITGLNMTGACLTGSNLLTLFPGDGYYDVNLATGEKTKRMDAHLESSGADIPLPELIFESTLIYRPGDDFALPAGTPHVLAYYDGKDWKDVALPESLANDPDGHIYFLSVASDRAFFGQRLADEGTFNLYYILLDAEAPELTLCAAIAD